MWAPALARRFADAGHRALAREFWPHVAHVVIDGVLDTPHLRAGDLADTDESLLDVDTVAKSYLALSRQDPGAWSFELAMRPHGERFFE